MQTKISRIPETNDELSVEMQNEGMTEFKSKAIFLQSVLMNRQWHNIKLSEEDVKKYTPIFLKYLKNEEAKKMIKIEISEGIYGHSEDNDVEICFPPECSCDCYCCSEPCDFCEAVLTRFPDTTGRSAMSYGVRASVDEFVEFLAEYRKEEDEE